MSRVKQIKKAKEENLNLLVKWYEWQFLKVRNNITNITLPVIQDLCYTWHKSKIGQW